MKSGGTQLPICRIPSLKSPANAVVYFEEPGCGCAILIFDMIWRQLNAHQSDWSVCMYYDVNTHNPIGVVYKGKVELNEIKFTREVEGWVGPEFVAKREFQRNNGLVPGRTTPLTPPLPKP